MRGEHRVAALIVAAGQGVRAGGSLPKQYRMIGGKPVLTHAIDALLAHSAIDCVQIVIGADHGDLYAAAVGERPLPRPVIGGEARRDSVIAGLEAIDADIVLIHDAARPFLPSEVIDRLLEALDGAEGSVPTLPVADTLARAATTGKAYRHTGIIGDSARASVGETLADTRQRCIEPFLARHDCTASL